MKRRTGYLLSLTVAFLLLGLAPAQALEVYTDLQFSATDSLWNVDLGPAFSTDGSRTVDLPSPIPDINVSYDIGVSPGTVDLLYQGDLRVDYQETLVAPGTTSLGLDFFGDSGTMQTDLGAWVEVQLAGAEISEGPALNIDTNFNPEIDAKVIASDSETVAGTGIDFLGLAEVGVNVELEQTSTFEATAIDGVLAYSLSGSSSFNSMPFSLDTAAGLTFDVDLFDVGTWNFWFTEIALDNLFSTSFDVGLVLYEEHTTISTDTVCVDTCITYLYGYCVGFGEVCTDYPTIETANNSYTLLELDLYDGSPFALEFNPITTEPLFSIDVGSAPVPEPATVLLLGSGLVGLAWYGRKRKKA